MFADRTGLEPATSAVTGQHSNQLNYRSKFLFGILTIPIAIGRTTDPFKGGKDMSFDFLVKNIFNA